MPFQCESQNIGWTFRSTNPPLCTYAVIFFKYPEKESWKVSVEDLTSGQTIDRTTCLQEPTQERAELILRCYVDTDQDLESFIHGRQKN